MWDYTHGRKAYLYGDCQHSVSSYSQLPGEQYDSDLNLHCLRARYYNPATGRFMSRDRADSDVQDPASLHKYLHADGESI